MCTLWSYFLTDPYVWLKVRVTYLHNVQLYPSCYFLFLRYKYSNHVFSFPKLHNLCLRSLQTKALCGILYFTYPAMGCWCPIQSPELWDPLSVVACTTLPWGHLFCPQPKACHAWCCHTSPASDVHWFSTHRRLWYYWSAEYCLFPTANICCEEHEVKRVLTILTEPALSEVCKQTRNFITVSHNNRFLHELILRMLNGRVT